MKSGVKRALMSRHPAAMAESQLHVHRRPADGRPIQEYEAQGTLHEFDVDVGEDTPSAHGKSQERYPMHNLDANEQSLRKGPRPVALLSRIAWQERAAPHPACYDSGRNG
jgi:hypothetical protein